MWEREELKDQFYWKIKARLSHKRRIKSEKEEYFSIHRDKLGPKGSSAAWIGRTPEDILDLLREKDIIRVSCDGPWIDMKMKDAEIYMAMMEMHICFTQRREG